MLCNETYKLSINCLNDYENCKKCICYENDTIKNAIIDCNKFDINVDSLQYEREKTTENIFILEIYESIILLIFLFSFFVAAVKQFKKDKKYMNLLYRNGTVKDENINEQFTFDSKA